MPLYSHRYQICRIFMSLRYFRKQMKCQYSEELSNSSSRVSEASNSLMILLATVDPCSVLRIPWTKAYIALYLGITDAILDLWKGTIFYVIAVSIRPSIRAIFT